MLVDLLLCAGALAAGERAEPAPPAPAGLQQKKRGASASSVKKEDDRPLQPFVGDLRAARAEARERNVPILILMALEGEEASDRFRNGFLPDPGLARACRDAVVIFSNNGVHDIATVVEEVDGRKIETSVCSLYRTPTCTDHQRTWDQAFLEFNENGELSMPHVLVLDPEGKLAGRVATRDVPPVGSVTDLVERTQRTAGRGLSVTDLQAIRDQLEPARRGTESKSWAQAWRCWQAILAITEHGRYGDEARAGADAARTALEAELASARALLVPGTAARGYAALAKLQAEVEGLPIAEPVAQALREAERDKQLKDEIRVYKLEAEAEALWREAQALLAAQETKKAERVVRKLLGSKKLAGTSAAQKAREAHPEWAEEEAG